MLKIAGLYPWIDSQPISGDILPHFDVNNIFGPGDLHAPPVVV